MSDRLPPDYAPQHGCHDCAAVFRWSDHDEGQTYFCCDDAPERPLCGSVGMGECFWILPDGSWDCEDDGIGHHRSIAWDEWSEGREVEPWGICERWEETR